MMALTDLPSGPERNRKSALESIVPYTSVALIIAVLYVAWTFYSRYESNRTAEQAIQAKKDEARKRIADQIFGSGAVRLATLSADRGVLKRGQSTEFCYGVVNATTVKIEPPVEPESKPSYHHCIEIAPKQTTSYTLTASDAAGHTKSASITIQVK